LFRTVAEQQTFMLEVLNKLPVEQEIIREIAAQNTTVNWLAAKVKVSHHHLYKCLGMAQEKRKLSDGLKKRISEVLGKEF
jgi:hypothetical protein